MLQLDPGEDDAAERIITELERRGESTILRAFREQWQNLLPPNAENMELGELMAYVNSRLLTAQPTVDAIARVLYDAAAARVNIALTSLTASASASTTRWSTRGRRRAKRYSGELITNIKRYDQAGGTAGGRALVRQWRTAEALVDDLQPTFSKRRAKLISQQKPRGAPQGSRLDLGESGVVTGMVGRRRMMKRVCPIAAVCTGRSSAWTALFTTPCRQICSSTQAQV